MKALILLLVASTASAQVTNPQIVAPGGGVRGVFSSVKADSVTATSVYSSSVSSGAVTATDVYSASVSAGAVTGKGASSFFSDIQRGSNNNFFNLCIEGDSLTAGYPTGTAIGNRLAPVTFFGYPMNIFNFGSSGQNLRWMVEHPVGSIDVSLSPYAGMQIFMLWFGTNDVWQHTSVGLMESYYRAICNHARQAGFDKIIACTLQSCWYNGGATTDNIRLAFNSRIRAGWRDYADAIADFGADPRIGASGAATNTTYFSNDLIHLLEPGAEIVADYMDLAIAQVTNNADSGGLRMPQHGTTAPTPVPRYPGDMYVDSAGATIYISTCAESVTCWKQVSP